MPRFPNKALTDALNLTRSKAEKLTSPLPHNATSQTVLKTADVRINIQKDPRNPDERVARNPSQQRSEIELCQKWIQEYI
jgi:hypothetical protein